MSESNATFFYNNQDHTLGNLVRQQLLKDPEIIFAAYKVPHPLTRSVEIRVQTIGTPAADSVDSALNALTNNLNAFDEAFNNAVGS